jgi:hypothetical protein
MHKRIVTAALSAFAIGVIAFPVSGPAQEPMELTAMDYIEIQQLVAKYARAIDTCSNNGYDYADLYTPNGRFVPMVNGRSIPPIEGRERLAQVSGGGSNNCENVPWIEQGVRHIYTNHIITPTPDGASAKTDGDDSNSGEDTDGDGDSDSSSDADGDGISDSRDCDCIDPDSPTPPPPGDGPIIN